KQPVGGIVVVAFVKQICGRIGNRQTEEGRVGKIACAVARGKYRRHAIGAVDDAGGDVLADRGIGQVVPEGQVVVELVLGIDAQREPVVMGVAHDAVLIKIIGAETVLIFVRTAAGREGIVG